MGFEKMKDRLRGMVSKNSEKIDQGLDKATDYVDKRTGGKYSDKIDSAADQARDYKSKLAGDDQGGQSGEPDDQGPQNPEGPR